MTDEDKKLILEWCGIFWGTSRNPETMDYEGGWYIHLKTKGACMAIDIPDLLDLNFYFKYAVPKLKLINIDFDFTFNEDTGGRMCEVSLEPYTGYGSRKICYPARDFDPAEAFGQALLKLIKEGG